jgi:VWFA-related protein
MNFHTMEELDYQRQKQLLEKRTEANLSRLDLKAPGKARSEYTKGMQAIAQKNYQSAIDQLTKAITIYPDYVAAHSALGYAYFNMKQPDRAHAEFARAVELDDHLSGAYLNLGRVEMATGDMPSAQKSLEKASSLTPLDDGLLMMLAYVQLMNKDYSGVIQTAQRTHNRPHPDSAGVHYFSAIAWQGQKNYDETTNELQTFVSEAPNSGMAGQARQYIARIKEAKNLPSEDTRVEFAAAADPSMHGQKVLQDLREKQQIAEAEAEGSAGYTRDPALSAPATASSAPASPRIVSSGVDGGWTLRHRVEEVALFFTATDHGKSVTDLKQNEVVLHDDGRAPQAILGFRSESGLPLRLGLLIDTSVSITDRFAFEQKAAINFLQQVVSGKEDRAFVAGFSNTLIMVQDFTNDQNQLAKGINQLVPIGGTSLWDAVSFGADKLAEEKESQPVARILVVFSDGDDNSSSATLKQAIEHAERDDVIVYTVSTREADPGNDLVLPGNHAMRVLAELTGGTAFFPGSQSRFTHSLADLQEVIRGRYLIAYKPAEFQHDGRYRQISLTAARSGHKLKVYSRKGYYTRNDMAAAATHPDGLAR